LAQASLEGDAVRACRACCECRIEIELEPRIKNQIVCTYQRDVNFMVAFGMHFAEIVFVQKVVCDDQPLFILSQAM